MNRGGQEPPRPERHQPLPGIARLPGYLYNRLSRRGKIVIALTALALVVAAAVTVPLVRDSKREGEARERVRDRQRQIERRREQTVEQRPRYGRSSVPGRRATYRALDRAIVADVATRLRSGELETPARRADCVVEAIRRDDAKTQLSCTAVTSDIEASEFSSAGSVGYTYRALVDPRRGKFAFCKVVGRPGEGSFARRGPPPLSRACGG